MSSFCCCCDCFISTTADERHPFSRANPPRLVGGNVYENVPPDSSLLPDPGPASSKRTTHGSAAAPADWLKDQKVLLKLVDVPDVDKLFSDIADTYNEQQEQHLVLENALKELQQASRCLAGSSVKTCMEKLKLESGDHDVQMQMKGYTFTLQLKEDREVPENLEHARAQVEKLSRATKLILANETKLQEMIRSVLQSEAQLAESVKQTPRPYLDQLRVEANLEDNFQKVGMLQQKSKPFHEAAKSILNDVAELSGISL